jgi:hypothetical protein
LKQMDLDYIDLYLAHWPYAAKPVSEEALKNSKAGPGGADGIMKKDDKPVIDWKYTSSNVAKKAG